MRRVPCINCHPRVYDYRKGGAEGPAGQRSGSRGMFTKGVATEADKVKYADFAAATGHWHCGTCGHSQCPDDLRAFEDEFSAWTLDMDNKLRNPSRPNDKANLAVFLDECERQARKGGHALGVQHWAVAELWTMTLDLHLTAQRANVGVNLLDCLWRHSRMCAEPLTEDMPVGQDPPELHWGRTLHIAELLVSGTGGGGAKGGAGTGKKGKKKCKKGKKGKKWSVVKNQKGKGGKGTENTTGDWLAAIRLILRVRHWLRPEGSA